ncbi:MAG: DUF2341 domain-containing protein [Gammaproteobacteria bacterium]
MTVVPKSILPGLFLIAILNLAGCGSGFKDLPEPPLVQTQSVPEQKVAQTSATLQGIVNPNGSDVAAWFEWGLSENELQQSERIPLGNTIENIAVEKALVDLLTPDTTYYYRIVVISTTGELTYGALHTFHTPPIPVPEAITAAPGATTPTSCALNGAINPNGFSTSAWFEWGPDETYGKQTEQQPVGDGLLVTVLSQTITNLSQVTDYHYRIISQNDGGRVVGEDVVCTTLRDTAGELTDPNLDSDNDGLTNSQEINQYSTAPLNPDTDGDGLNDGDEVNQHGTDPLNPDSDNDGLLDGKEVTVTLTRPVLADTDSDGISDGSEVNVYQTDPLSNADADQDGLTDSEEILNHDTNPHVVDSDNDGLSDGEEVNVYATHPLNADTDNDGLYDGDEVVTHLSNPLVVDSDGDGLTDGDEVNLYQTNPVSQDSDGDSLNDKLEIDLYKTNPNQSDTDGDGINDADEINIFGTNPNLADTDSDALSDGDENSNYKTDPLNSDTDSDGINDGDEINLYQTNPLIPDSDNDELSDGDEINVYQTDPLNPDTDGDGLIDGREIRFGLDPLVFDTVSYFSDLMVTDLSGPAGVVGGQQVTITDTVKNNSVLDSGVFTVGYYLSKDAVLDRDDLMIGKRNVAGLTGGLANTATTQITTPLALPEGIYYLVAKVDANDQVVEESEVNNSLVASRTISAATSFYDGDGSEGSASVNTVTNLSTGNAGASLDRNGVNADGFTTLLAADAKQGDSLITVNDTSGFVTGDEVMIIQVIHDSNHGVYEFQRNITVVDATTITFNDVLGRNYMALGQAQTGTTNTVQVVRVPNYDYFAVSVGTVLTTNAFDKVSGMGGILAFRAKTLMVEGKINADGLGYPGAVSPVTDVTNGVQGWSFAGRGARLPTGQAGAGGGGRYANNIATGGGGAGHFLYGNNGVDGGGMGGSDYRSLSIDKLYLGSGGGSGARFNGNNGQGGNGGGMIYGVAGTMIIAATGSVSAGGGDGGNATGFRHGGGGGGSGGTVYLASPDRLANAPVSVTGGIGGTSVGDFLATDGGDGSRGSIYMPNITDPDLLVTDIGFPTSIVRGSTVSVLNSISNAINTDILDPFTVKFYLSSDQAITANDSYLGRRIVSALSANATDTAYTNLTLPLDIPVSNHGYRKTITINAMQVSGSTDLVDFPVLVSVTDIDLATVANAGKVENANGYDIEFRAVDGITPLDFEREHYNPVTGSLVAWVRLPTISATVNTPFYIYYGNTTVTASRENAAAVWSAYGMVQHFNETSGTMLDSTVNANNGIGGGTVNLDPAQQKIGGAGSAIEVFNENSYVSIADSAALDLTDKGSVSVWVNDSAAPEGYAGILVKGGVAPAISTDSNYHLGVDSITSGATIRGYRGSISGSDLRSTSLYNSDGTWDLLTLTWDGSVARLYRDGVQIEQMPQIQNAIANSGPLEIGRRRISSTDTRQYRGLIDEVRVSNQPRSANWIATEFSNQENPEMFYTVGAEEAMNTTNGQTVYFGMIVDSENVVPELNENNNVKLFSDTNGTPVAVLIE